MSKCNRFHSFYSTLVHQTKNNCALIFEQNNQAQKWTYEALVQHIDAFPLQSGSTIGIFCDGSLDSLLAIFAYAKAKRQIVLLSPLESKETLSKQIQKTYVSTLIGPEELVSEYQPYLSHEKENKTSDILFFTSGTTSSSKAVVLTEDSLCSAAYNGSSLLPLKEEDKLLCILPLSHVFGFVCSMLWGFSCGAAVILSRGIRHLMDDCLYFKPTAISLVPQMAGFFALHHLFNPELKLCLIGAGVCSDPVLMAIKSLGIKVSYGYGLTETSSGIALSLGDDPRAMTICPDYQVKIAKDQEILVHSSTTLMKGYFEEEKDTKEAFDKDGYLKTGDLGKIDKDGCLHILGRKKEILVLGDGTKIFLPEYETKLGLLLGPDNDFAVTLDKANRLILAIFTKQTQERINDLVKQFNLRYPRGQRISLVKYFTHALPKTQTGKVKRYAIHVD